MNQNKEYGSMVMQIHRSDDLGYGHEAKGVSTAAGPKRFP